ncbi:response regulator [Selenihalanaerobacter shriftii]|uniref:Stage 0 sporulation protein A homolog n=1 Tax=Selenihalanaerobacter shriftii TaxID=142842 RepID=A0A1T4NWF2_9FIRM|nr:response regulator transcription factor [Selenihalanaerobacter shriftii]SJZ83387.1 two component transcriptional regulator, LuxR family [Selenihalanaerobacter shriftii]
MSKVKIILADDHGVVRVGLVTLLEQKSEFEVVAQASSANEAIKKTEEYQPDVVLLDIKMPPGDYSGIDACRRICNNQPNVEVIMLSSYKDDEAIVKSIMAGASGYVLKEINNKELITAVEKVSRGESLLDPKVTKKVLQHMRKSENEADQDDEKLTDKEREILEFLSEGLTNRKIAKKVNLTEKTVRNYVSNILKKLDFDNRVEAATYITKKKMRK